MSNNDITVTMSMKQYEELVMYSERCKELLEEKKVLEERIKELEDLFPNHKEQVEGSQKVVQCFLVYFQHEWGLSKDPTKEDIDKWCDTRDASCMNQMIRDQLHKDILKEQ